MTFLNVANRKEAVSMLKGIETRSYFANEENNCLTVLDNEGNFLFEIEGNNGLNGKFENVATELSRMESEATL